MPPDDDDDVGQALRPTRPHIDPEDWEMREKKSSIRGSQLQNIDFKETKSPDVHNAGHASRKTYGA